MSTPNMEKAKKKAKKSMGRPPLKAGQRAVATNILIPQRLWEEACRLIPNPTQRNGVVAKLLQIYVDRLLSQATNAPEELMEELESLLVTRASDEVLIEDEDGIEAAG